ncbi:MAG TPA: hypothetical protein PKV55_10905 [Nitrospira sp.]|nr:hypothetical protein [Nitrospira sp.]HMZ54954.1 hypothetical protein [Nitrospira sp.]HNA27549.1 hypothetical protein [Nitrospira sp.]HNI68541.1 hypothetical protein [Nitrospira sp.]HNK14886.1 hypothetical protein [Nitrospira sp.]
MSQRTMLYAAFWILMVGGIEGCTTMQPGSSTTLPSSAFFQADPVELKPLQAIAHAQDSRMKNCHKGPACEEAYYTRALVALFENRADAITVFQELRTAMPNSRYEGATTGWLNLLQDTAVSTSQNKALMVQLKHEVLHHLLDRGDLTASRAVKDHERRVAELAR